MTDNVGSGTYVLLLMYVIAGLTRNPRILKIRENPS